MASPSHPHPPVPTGPKMVAVQNYHGNPAPPGKPVLTFQTGDVIELLRGDPESQWWEVGPAPQAGWVGVSDGWREEGCGQGLGASGGGSPWKRVRSPHRGGVLASRPLSASPRPAHPSRCDQGRQPQWPRRDALLLCQRRARGQLLGAQAAPQAEGMGRARLSCPHPGLPDGV